MDSKTSLLDLALLSKKVYGGFKDSDIPQGLVNQAKLWIPIPETSYNSRLLQDAGEKRKGFYACVYENFVTNERVLVIKGTNADSKLDLFTDFQYGITDILNNRWDMLEYKELNKYMFYLSSMFGGSYYNEQNKENDYFSIKYVCGHSLGGIMAKMIACQCHFNGVAFNSPSVKNVIKHYNIIANYKSIRTVYCKNDLVTNLNPDLFGEKYVLDSGFSPKNNKKNDFTDIRKYLQDKWKEIKEEAKLSDEASRTMGMPLYGGEIVAYTDGIKNLGSSIYKDFGGEEAFNNEFNYQHGIDTIINTMLSIQKYKLPVSIV